MGPDIMSALPGAPLLIAWLGSAILMGACWWIQRRTRVVAIVDLAWAVVTPAVAIGLMAVAAAPLLPRALLLALLIGIWGLRLAWHLRGRLRDKREDGRYRAMKQALGARVRQPALFAFFQVQALWAVLFALPVAAASLAPRATLDWLDGLGAAVWLTALAGESLADRQLARFRAARANHDRVCRAGLWAWSRHPNYFFEWLHWLAYVLIGYASPVWWLTLAGLALMYVFLNHVTGIPFTERQALRSRGEAYRQYQATTSRFFPVPPTDRPAAS